MQVGFDIHHELNRARHPVMATIATTHFDATIKAYQSVLGYELVDSSNLSTIMAEQWGLAGLEGARLSLMRPQSGVPVFFRFLEISNKLSRGPSCGWFALELCVQDVEALYQRLMKTNGFTPFAEPTPLAFTDRVYPMQCKGPAGEILYMNQVRGSLPDIDLPLANSVVDHLFIAILSAVDMEAANDFYCELMDMTVNERHEIAYKTINRVHGLPLETFHKLSTLGGPRHVGLEVDQYPGLANPPRASTAKTIGEGIVMVSFITETFNVPESALIKPPKQIDDAPYNGAMSAVLLGPAAERTELIKLAH